MFSKSTKTRPPETISTSTQPATATITSTGKSAVPSIIATDMQIKGELKSHGELHIEGVVEGDIDVRKLVVGIDAVVRGQINADSVRICGTVNGKITAREVTLANTARMQGDIHHEILSIESGAKLEGMVKRLDSVVETGATQLLSVPAPLD